MALLAHAANTVRYALPSPFTASDKSWSGLVHSHYFKRLQSAQIQHYVLLHNATPAETLSSGVWQPAGSVHTWQHVTVTFLLSTTALISIYLQTNTGGKVNVPAGRLRVMARMKVPLSLPSLSESHRMADEAQISSDISAVTCYRHRPSVLNQNVRAQAWQEGWGVGRQAWRGPDRGPPLSLPSWRMPSSLSVAFYLSASCCTGAEPKGWPWVALAPLESCYQSQTVIWSWVVGIMDGLLTSPTGRNNHKVTTKKHKMTAKRCK